MSFTTIQVRIANNGTPVDLDYAIFSNQTEELGVIRIDTNESVVPLNTPLERKGVGWYSYTFEDPDYDLTYQYFLKYQFNGKIYWLDGFQPGTRYRNEGETAYIDDLIIEIKVRGRFDQIDNLITGPIDAEIEFAILDAISDINLHPPQTSFTLERIMESTDKRWKRMLILGATKNVLSTLYHDHVQNGIVARVGDGAIEYEDRTSIIKELLDFEIEQFNDKLDKLKSTSQKFCKGLDTATQSLIKQYPRSLAVQRLVRFINIR